VTVRSAVPEIALCAAWHVGSIPRPFQTIDGTAVDIVHRGFWSHGLGPDFQDSLLLFGAQELRAGAVEVHLRTRGWIDHGHHLDPAYDSVILHVVAQHDGSETRRQDGALVPVLEIGHIDASQVPDMAGWDWDRVGGHACAERIAADRPDLLRTVLHRLGDARLAARAARLEARLVAQPPGEILWSELLDGLGYAANRAPMRALAARVPAAALESSLKATRCDDRAAVARGVLLGCAGFLPLSPAEADLGRLTAGNVRQLESAWRERAAAWRDALLPSTGWNLSRVRPANHPVPRLLAAASVITIAGAGGGLVAALLALVRDAPDAVAALRGLTSGDGSPGIGDDRAIDIIASVLLPFALACAEQSGDGDLGDAARALWERLPDPARNAVTRRAAAQVAGTARLSKIGARGAQGLIQLDTALCQPRRCFECPVAQVALSSPVDAADIPTANSQS
jgi:hypothetical protein